MINFCWIEQWYFAHLSGNWALNNRVDMENE